MERSPNSDEAGSFDELLKDAAATPDVTSRRRVKVGATIMNGRFVIERQLGEGGMGIVYQARDTKRGTDVALKMLSHLDATGIYGIKKEFRSLADVVHENLVGLHELFADGDEWFFTMDLVEGVPFTEYVRTDPALGFEATLSSDPLGAPFDATLEAPGGVTGSRGSGALRETRLREVLRQLVAAVSAIHGAGKLHRDLKPSNVLVRRGGRVVILDFGLAKDHADSDATQTIDGGDRRDARVHGARAGACRTGDDGKRLVRGRRDALRGSHGQPSVRGTSARGVAREAKGPSPRTIRRRGVRPE